ncbi:2-amino-4-hydroxy-6-hydroxymethyldihydropteridine diphosphokinase [Rhizomicrobium electricum]|jgi:2-amino-4-hydroxy-6-hydroxymethyldihydropteridine diphosphokinase|uniref:2-amino-4-hydroxy-6-hydroxymethyldihydropteridine pyrophosphokinase n=1 Tax=Rhizomicrobium electricum TaxID=480070 RepID=A0ABP3P0V8_9PROT|nr:2-amino-4-hydroxy-6-hydroxymethyldihydropteridine diphosphokinase [Rhizomicrobium electricum]NIJ47518.1 2-amino-4-hydroxy-6-hydroxymethyldihydropteridine diphosphokinase [Rhizomicrobium electricum]
MILIALGANLSSAAGPPAITIASSLGAMAAQRIRVLKVSPFYSSPAWPDPSEPPYVNGIALVQTPLGPSGLLAALHAIEAEFGRERTHPNAPRTLDLDLIDYDGRVEEGPPVLPHPRAATRAFVLKPLADVAPGWVHPVSGKTVAALLTALPEADVAAVLKTTA